MAALAPGDPDRVGEYVLLARLGSGGMGRVYLGRSPGGRLVAVKVIRAELAEDPEFRARFAQEVAAARKVNAAFTAPVIDARVDGELPWIVTSYVPGPDLGAAVRERGPMSAEAAGALAAGLAEGLRAIHAVGVIHRDLKPQNVLLAQDGPHIIDFGIAKATEQLSLTPLGVSVGSPGFMSPEQAAGQEVSTASDMFSLGAVLTFAATGAGPFGSGDASALLYRAIHSSPNISSVPDKLRPLVAWCMIKDPTGRPSATEFLRSVTAVYPASAELTDWVAPLLAEMPNGGTITVPPPTPVPRPRTPTVRDSAAAKAAPTLRGFRRLTARQRTLGLVGFGAAVALVAVIALAINLTPSSPQSQSGKQKTPTVTVTSTHSTSPPSPTQSTPQPAPTVGTVGYLGLRTGDCLTGSNLDLNINGPWPTEFDVVPCSQPHVGEVIFSDNNYFSPTTVFPGSTAAVTQVNDKCAGAFTSYTGGSSAYRSYSWKSYLPFSSSGWQSGPRQVFCVAYDPTTKYPAGAHISGSIKAAAKR